jgi:hypothetical protein
MSDGHHTWVGAARIPVDEEAAEQAAVTGKHTVDVDTPVEVTAVRCSTCGGPHTVVAEQPCPGPRQLDDVKILTAVRDGRVTVDTSDVARLDSEPLTLPDARWLFGEGYADAAPDAATAYLTRRGENQLRVAVGLERLADMSRAPLPNGHNKACHHQIGPDSHDPGQVSCLDVMNGATYTPIDNPHPALSSDVSGKPCPGPPGRTVSGDEWPDADGPSEDAIGEARHAEDCPAGGSVPDRGAGCDCGLGEPPRRTRTTRSS